MQPDNDKAASASAAMPMRDNRPPPAKSPILAGNGLLVTPVCSRQHRHVTRSQPGLWKSNRHNEPCRHRAFVHDDSTKRRAASEASWKEKATELILGGLMPSWRCQGFLNSFFNRRTTRLFCRARTPFGRPPKDCGCWPVTIPSEGYPP